MLERDLVVTLLVKVAVAASHGQHPDPGGCLQAHAPAKRSARWCRRVQFALAFAAIFGAGVAVRVITHGYPAADLGLEGSLLSGMLGGYVTGLISGVLISIPAMAHREYLSMALFAGVGVLGGLASRPGAEHRKRYGGSRRS